MFPRLANGHFGDRVHHPLEVVFTNECRFAVRSGIAKVDRNGLPVAHGEFHSVEIVTEKLIQSQNALLDFLQDFFWSVPLRSVTQMKRVPWLVGHDADAAL